MRKGDVRRALKQGLNVCKKPEYHPEITNNSFPKSPPLNTWVSSNSNVGGPN